MSVWAWLKFTAFLWLLRKAVKLTGWLLLAGLAVAAWPVTLEAAAGYRSITRWGLRDRRFFGDHRRVEIAREQHRRGVGIHPCMTPFSVRLRG